MSSLLFFDHKRSSANSCFLYTILDEKNNSKQDLNIMNSEIWDDQLRLSSLHLVYINPELKFLYCHLNPIIQIRFYKSLFNFSTCHI